jgi:hypothetical protein
MKPRILSFPTVIPAILAISAAIGLAQVADLPVVDPPPPPLSPAVPDPVSASLVAIIAPLGDDDMTSGGVIFIPTGDNVSVVGRIGGMEPNRRYEIALLPGGTPVSDLTPGESSPAGRPGSNTPASGVTGAERASPGEVLGMLTADANGAAIWDATLSKNVLAKFPNGLAGCTVVVKRAPPLDTPVERRPVAAGRVVAIPVAVPLPTR